MNILDKKLIARADEVIREDADTYVLVYNNEDMDIVYTKYLQGFEARYKVSVGGTQIVLNVPINDDVINFFGACDDAAYACTNRSREQEVKDSMQFIKEVTDD